VEVTVEREKVKVEQARVDVERQSLENRQTFDRASIEFETMKLRIEADKDVQMALAAALGQFMSKGNYNIGDGLQQQAGRHV
jgi:flotillin